MKNHVLSIAFIAFAFLFTTQAEAQKFSDLDKSPMDIASYPNNHRDSNKLVKITYSRPQLKGRPLTKLTPAGNVWRTGANEAAEITFYVPMKVGDKVIQPGSYTLFTIPGSKEWTVILSSDLNVWGAYSYKEANDIVRAKAKVSKGDTELEAFSIVFEEGMGGIVMHMGWGNQRIALPMMLVNK